MRSTPTSAIERRSWCSTTSNSSCRPARTSWPVSRAGRPNVRLLVTSRELLRIAGERGHPIPPLDVTAGIALFVDRARSHRPDLVLGEDTLAAIRAISERLDGLPLALELAAARVRVMSPASILERLGRSLDLAGGTRDLPERQRTLRGAVAWSHDLLAPEERRLFAPAGRLRQRLDRRRGLVRRGSRRRSRRRRR